MARASAKKGLRGRHWTVIVLGVFLLVTLAVAWRQATALATARRLATLERTRVALEVQRSALLGQIRRDRGRAVLVPLAERRLGLRLPQDSEITILQDQSLR
jgi:type II secretory pathway pseudopilin PulG